MPASPSPPSRRGAPPIAEDRILDAAFELLMAVGLRRMTMAGLARRSEVSRATLYRRWKDVGEVVGALITREWTDIANQAFSMPARHARERLVRGVVEVTRAVRSHPIERKIIAVDPEFFLPYIVHRRGAATRHHLCLIEEWVAMGIKDGSVQAYDAALTAQTVLISATAFILRAPVIAGERDGSGSRLDALDRQLERMLDLYLAHGDIMPES